MMKQPNSSCVPFLPAFQVLAEILAKTYGPTAPFLAHPAGALAPAPLRCPVRPRRHYAAQCGVEEGAGTLSQRALRALSGPPGVVTRPQRS
jgi:hypothetical protein